MEFNDYQEKARATAIYPNVGDNFVYPTLGLIDEIGELVGALGTSLPNDVIIKEAGDVLWYVASLASEVDLTLWRVAGCRNIKDIDPPNTYFLGGLFLSGAAIAGIVKKTLRDRDGALTLESKMQISHSLSVILHILVMICYHRETSLLEIAEENLKKLSDRQDRGVLHGSGDNR